MKRIAALILSFAFIICSMTFDVTATTKSSDRIISVIVVLEDRPLADSNMVRGIITKSELEKKQDYVINNIMRTMDDVKVKYRYTYIMNGFSIELPESEAEEYIEKICLLDGVSSAFIAPRFKPCLTDSTIITHADSAWNSGYDGSGMLIGIIDTGIVVNHDMFSIMPTNVKYSQQDINSIMRSNTTIAKGSVYKNAKIPFAYDYADNDNDVSHDGISDHGTHVAGIAAGNSESYEISGIARNAQLAVMKIYSGRENSNDAEFGVLVAALEDCAVIGVDVINMSLGAMSGFEYNASRPELMAVYERIENLGISVVAAAGNEGTFGEGSSNLVNPLSLPDMGTISEPASFRYSTAVASTTKESFESFKITSTDERIEFSDRGGAMNLYSLPNKEYEYVSIPNVGSYYDYSGIDVRGKIALVKRGTITFDEKIEYAYDNGAVAVIIYNTYDEVGYMNVTNYLIPAVFISSSAGKTLINQIDKRITLDNSGYSGYTMSDFSSWGTSADLHLKPEISAPGSSIISSRQSGFGTMSGTSMATPHIAGAYAVIRQYLKEKYSLSSTQLAYVAENLLMSTATAISYNGMPLSVRAQGAGVVNLENAVKSGAYVTVNGGKSKIELFDDPNKTGVYEFEFTIVNMSDSSRTYDISVDTVSNAIVSGNISLKPAKLSTQVEIDDRVQVNARSSKTVKGKITLSENARKYLDRFENGMFFEGFVMLKESYGRNLSVPFMGFYGDWTSQSIFDTVYFENDKTMLFNECGAYTILNGSKMLLGKHPYNEDDDDFYMDNVVISPNGDDKLDNLYYITSTLLKNAKEYRITIKDTSGNEVYKIAEVYQPKVAYDPEYKEFLTTDNLLEFGKTGVNNNDRFYVEISADIDYSRHESVPHSWGFYLNVDTQAPKVNDVSITEEDGTKLLHISISDNTGIAMVKLLDKSGKTISTQYLAGDKEYEKTLDITGYEDVYVQTGDFGMNEVKYKAQKAEEVPDYDVNEDGFVNTLDAVYLLEYFAEIRDLTDNQMNIADVDKSGFVNTFDCVVILNYLAEM